MRATIVGLEAPQPILEAALTSLAPGQYEFRVVESWTWVALPLDARQALTQKLAARLGKELVGIDVEMSPGGRGHDVRATRYSVPRSGPAQNLTRDAREMLHEWKADGGGGFDEEDAVIELAWALLDAVDPQSAEPSECFEDRWAAALLARLVGNGDLELRPRSMPNGEVAAHLAKVDAENAMFGERLLDVLVSSTAVAEVFADAEQLAVAARETRPDEPPDVASLDVSGAEPVEVLRRKLDAAIDAEAWDAVTIILERLHAAELANDGKSST